MSDRVERIKGLFSSRVRQRALADRSVDAAAANLVIDRIIAADPCPRKSHSNWLVKVYIAGGFLAEDLSKASDTLSLFDSKKALLPVDRRDIGRYGSLAALWTSVAPYADHAVASQRSLDRDAKLQAQAESRTLYDGDDMTIVAPLTQEAAAWWGMNTRWCTSAKKDNAFGSYFKDGPLLIFIMPDGVKFQLHIDMRRDNDFTFMTAADETVVADDIRPYWGKLGSKLMGLAVSYNHTSGAISTLLREMLSDAEMEAFIRDNPTMVLLSTGDMFRRLSHYVDMGAINLWHLSAGQFECLSLGELQDIALRDEASCRALICVLENYANRSDLVEWLLNDDRVRDTYLQTVSDVPALLSVAREHLGTEEYAALVRRAVGFNSKALSFVAPGDRSEAIDILAATAYNHQAGLGIVDVPRARRTRAVCEAALVGVDGVALVKVGPPNDAFMHIPEHLADQDMFCLALGHHPGAILHAKPHLIDKSGVIEFVAQNPLAIRYVPKTMLDRDILLALPIGDTSAAWLDFTHPVGMPGFLGLGDGCGGDTAWLEQLKASWVDVERIFKSENESFFFQMLARSGNFITFIPRDLITRDMLELAYSMPCNDLTPLVALVHQGDAESARRLMMQSLRARKDVAIFHVDACLTSLMTEEDVIELTGLSGSYANSLASRMTTGLLEQVSTVHPAEVHRLMEMRDASGWFTSGRTEMQALAASEPDRFDAIQQDCLRRVRVWKDDVLDSIGESLAFRFPTPSLTRMPSASR